MSVRWRDIRATIEGRESEITPTTQDDPGINLEVHSGSNEERESVLEWVDELHDIETIAAEAEGCAPGETASFELENYVSARYLDILSDEATLVEGTTETESVQRQTSVPGDASSAAFAVHGEEWTVW